MPAFKSGDLVVLKSGGPVMTIDTVNTDIFDDDKITGLLCVWFVGNKLERVRFDHRAVDLADLQAISANTEYHAVLDDMVGAMNSLAEQTKPEKPAPRRRKVREQAMPSEDTPLTDT